MAFPLHQCRQLLLSNPSPQFQSCTSKCTVVTVTECPTVISNSECVNYKTCMFQYFFLWWYYHSSTLTTWDFYFIYSNSAASTYTEWSPINCFYSLLHICSLLLHFHFNHVSSGFLHCSHELMKLPHIQHPTNLLIFLKYYEFLKSNN